VYRASKNSTCKQKTSS